MITYLRLACCTYLSAAALLCPEAPAIAASASCREVSQGSTFDFSFPTNAYVIMGGEHRIPVQFETAGPMMLFSQQLSKDMFVMFTIEAGNGHRSGTMQIQDGNLKVLGIKELSCTVQGAQ